MEETPWVGNQKNFAAVLHKFQNSRDFIWGEPDNRKNNEEGVSLTQLLGQGSPANQHHKSWSYNPSRIHGRG